MSKKIAICVCFVFILFVIFLSLVCSSSFFSFTESNVGRKKIVTQKKFVKEGKKDEEK